MRLAQRQIIWLITPVILVFIILSLSPLKEGDLWWHIEIGKIIEQNKSIPTTDVFGFASQGQSFYYTRYWLSDLFLFFIFHIGGLATLVLSQAITITLIIGIILYLSLERSHNPVVSAITAFLLILGLYPFSSIRPQIFSFLIFTLILWVLYHFRYSHRNRLWILPILIMLWVNLHAAWIIGILLIGVYTGFSIIETLLKNESLSKNRSLVFWSLTSLGIIFVNPIGFGIFRDVITVSTNPIVNQFVSEWQPISIHFPYTWLFFFLLGLSLLIIIFSKIKPDIVESGLILIFLIFSIKFVRFLPFFYILIIPTLSMMMSGLNISRFKVERKAKNVDIPSIKSINIIFIMIMLGMTIFSVPQIRLKIMGLPDSSLVDDYFPIGAANYLADLPQAEGRLFSLAEWGGYLEHRLHPEMSIFVDGRIEQFPVSVWQDYYQLLIAGSKWKEIIEKYDFDYLILSKERQAKLITELREAGIDCPYEDSTAVVCINSS